MNHIYQIQYIDNFNTDETLTTVSAFRELSPHSLTSDLMDNAGFRRFTSSIMQHIGVPSHHYGAWHQRGYLHV